MKKKQSFCLTLTLMVLLGFVFTFPISISAKTSSPPTSLIPENARWVIHLDMKKFTSTRLFDLLIKDETNNIAEKRLEFSKMFKFDPLTDIREITLFGLGKGEKNTVVCVAGNFNKEHLLFLLGTDAEHRETPYGKYTIHNWDRSRFGTFVDDHLVVMANTGNALKTTLDVIAGKTKNFSASKSMSQWQGIPRTAFIRAVIDNISYLAGVGEKSQILKKTGMAFFIALEKNQNLTLKLRMTTDSPGTAQNIQQIVTGFIALVRLKKDGDDIDPLLLKVLDNLEVKLQGNIVHVELSRPSQEIVRLISQGKRGFAIFD